MSEKRRDKKGRLLRNGEQQRSDGRYEYRYVDSDGTRRSIYSWKLVATDPLPSGKRNCIPLRDQEKEIERDIDDGIVTGKEKDMPLNYFIEKYIASRSDWRPGTRRLRVCAYETHIKDSIGKMRFSVIKPSDVKTFYISIAKTKGPTVITLIDYLFHPVFDAGVKDGIIRSNPSKGALNDVRKTLQIKQGKRHPLTVDEQREFIEFMYSNIRFATWAPLFIFLLGTGCRINEALGLRWDDCDFQNGIIHIQRALYLEHHYGGQQERHVGPTKTESGDRIIPMLNEVRQALTQVRLYQDRRGISAIPIDGVGGFVFVENNMKVLSYSGAIQRLKCIVKAYNKQAEMEEQMSGIAHPRLPNITPHILRHTFCTRFCEYETNLKVIQEVMGHSNITTTMNIYNEASIAKKIESFTNLDGKIYLG